MIPQNLDSRTKTGDSALRALVVIPCLNEADHIDGLLEQLRDPAHRLDLDDRFTRSGLPHRGRRNLQHAGDVTAGVHGFPQTTSAAAWSSDISAFGR